MQLAPFIRSAAILLALGSSVACPWATPSARTARASEQLSATRTARNDVPQPRPNQPDPRSRTTSTLERDVLAELNLLRANPARYAQTLEAMRGSYDGTLMRRGGGLPAIRTVEGEAALVEAIHALRAARAVGPLFATHGLALAADDHVLDEGPTGTVGHRGTDGSNSLHRIMRRGRSFGRSGEVIDYGWSTARDLVIDLLIDDGIRDRGHRHAILEPVYAQAGVACGDHKRFGVMCVVEMAERFVDRSTRDSTALLARRTR